MGRWGAYADANRDMVSKYNDQCPYCTKKLTGYKPNKLFGTFFGVVHRPASCLANKEYFVKASKGFIEDFAWEHLPSIKMSMEYVPEQSRVRISYEYENSLGGKISKGSFIQYTLIKEDLYEINKNDLRDRLLSEICRGDELWLNKLQISMELGLLRVRKKLNIANRQLDQKFERALERYK